MLRTFYDKLNGESEIMARKRRFWKDTASLSLEEKSPAAGKKISGLAGAVDEKEDHLTATYWG